jgi:hypothetical protein
LKIQKNCKICQTYHATELLCLYHIHHFTFKQIIAYFRKNYNADLNEFNVHCHLQRHVHQSDIEYVEKFFIIGKEEAEAFKAHFEKEEND